LRRFNLKVDKAAALKDVSESAEGSVAVVDVVAVRFMEAELIRQNKNSSIILTKYIRTARFPCAQTLNFAINANHGALADRML
jgi:hypothetical protein